MSDSVASLRKIVIIILYVARPRNTEIFISYISTVIHSGINLFKILLLILYIMG